MPVGPEDFVIRIRTSINKYFDSQKDSYRLFIEGQVPSIPGEDVWAELRINGPKIRQITKNDWKFEVGVDIMCSAKQTDDIYLIDRIVGRFVEVMIDIPVTMEEDEFWFCLKRQEEINTIPWGIVKGDLNTYSTSVSAEYKGDLRCPSSI